MKAKKTEKTKEKPVAKNAKQLSLSPFQAQLEKEILKLSGKPKHCARNAFRRIRQAWLLRKIDPEMAVFSALTAEEEAATALIVALKIRKYAGSAKLNPRSHPHKVGLIHMLYAVGKVFNECKLPKFICRINPSNTKARIDLGIGLKSLGLEDERVATPNEPLNMSISVENNGEKIIFNFEDQLNEIASEKNSKNFVEFIKKQANLRNETLYASDEGMPHVQIGENFFNLHLGRITLLLGLTIAVLQARNPQSLAQQILDAYLSALEKFSDKVTSENSN